MKSFVEIPAPDVPANHSADSKDENDTKVLGKVGLDRIQRPDYIRPDEEGKNET